MLPCSGKGGRCPALVRGGGKCPACATQDARTYGHMRGTPSQRGYGADWRAFRSVWLREHPLCGDRHDGHSTQHSQCRAEGRITAASHVDHIIPLQGATDETRLDPHAVQSLCRSCHSAKTAREDRGFGNSAQRHGR